MLASDGLDVLSTGLCDALGIMAAVVASPVFGRSAMFRTFISAVLAISQD